MKLALKIFLVALVSLAVGVTSFVLIAKSICERFSVKNGAWETNLAVGSKKADMYTRAAIARGGLFALKKSETVYYTAFTDDDGNALTSRCDYIIEGVDLDARWWSITAYGADHFLIPNKEHRYSYNMNDLQREPDGSYKIWLSADRKKKNWLPTGKEKSFSLTLRVYNPGRSVYENPGEARLPSIRKEACK